MLLPVFWRVVLLVVVGGVVLLVLLLASIFGESSIAMSHQNQPKFD